MAAIAHVSAAPVPGNLSPAQRAAFTAGAGREPTRRVCSRCHATEIITRQRMAPADWSRTVETMAGQGAPGSDADLPAITAYPGKASPAEQAEKSCVLKRSVSAATAGAHRGTVAAMGPCLRKGNDPI